MVKSFLEYTFLGKKPLNNEILGETRALDGAAGVARARKAKQPTALASSEAVEEIVDVATSELEVAEIEGESPQPRMAPITDSTRNKLIVLINLVLLLVCLTSFGTILYYAFRGLGEAPCTIQSTLVATLGYFGSALITFVENKT